MVNLNKIITIMRSKDKTRSNRRPGHETSTGITMTSPSSWKRATPGCARGQVLLIPQRDVSALRFSELAPEGNKPCACGLIIKEFVFSRAFNIKFH